MDTTIKNSPTDSMIEAGESKINKFTDGTTHKKFQHQEWKDIERKFENPITNMVLNMLAVLGNENDSYNHQNSLQTCGDEIYVTFREIMVNLKYVDKDIPTDIPKDVPKEVDEKKKGIKKEIKKEIKKLSKKDEIIRNNIFEKFKKTLESTIGTFSNDRINCQFGFRSPYAEIRLITFMYCASYLMKSNKKNINYSSCYELIIGIAKTLHNIKSMPNISKIACADLRNSFEELKIYCGFTFATMFEKYPRLCTSTIYDTVFPMMSIKPYASQAKLMKEIKSRNSGLYLYRAMINTGKTSMVVALAKYVEAQRVLSKANKVTNKLQVLFVCSVEPVRSQVCRIAYHMEIPFGIATNEKTGIKITNNYNCKHDSERIVIVSDLDSAIELLKRSQEYILFLDEPTNGADQKNNPITTAVANLLLFSPPKTILSSATLPDEKEITDITDYFKKLHAGAEIINIYSKESLIGCEIRDQTGITVLPHNNIKSCAELKNIIEKLRILPFIDRLYTAPVVYKMKNIMSQNGVNTIDLEQYFSDIANLSQSNIQKVAMTMLEDCVNMNSDTLVQKVCEPFKLIEDAEEKDKAENEKDEENNQTLEWTDQKVIETPKYPNQIFMRDAYKYMGQCLIIVNDAMNFALDAGKEILDMCGSNTSASKLIKQYRDVLAKHNESIEKLQNINEKKINRSSDKKSNDDEGRESSQHGKSDDKKSKVEQEYNRASYFEKKPRIQFPEFLKVNTIHHLVKYNQRIAKSIEKSKIRYPYILEDLPLDMQIPDEIMLLLFAGIGIYDPNRLNSEYTNLILSMAADGSLAFLVADDLISCGMSYPFSTGILDEKVADRHSMGANFQTFGRIGRSGETYKGEVYVTPHTVSRLMNYIVGTESIGISEEAANLTNAFKHALSGLSNIKKLDNYSSSEKKFLSDQNGVTKEVNIVKLRELVEFIKDNKDNKKRN